MKESLLHYSKTTYPFHMPGHKLGKINPLENINTYAIDVTEVEGTDNLFHPTGILKEAMKNASQLYQSKETYFLVNGSSCGLLTAICTCCKKGGKILVARNVHQSVYHGLMLHDINPIYIEPEYDCQQHVIGGVSPEKVKKLIEKNPDIEAILITSPTYEGFVSDIQKIAKIVHEKGKILIVDEAHGAHFSLHSFFPDSALVCGADIVVHSLHKTLPSLTQTALLHVMSDRINGEKLQTYLKVFQSSSPSYVLMTSIDECIRFIQKTGQKAFHPFVNNILNFEKNVDKLFRFQLIGNQLLGRKEIKFIDRSKLLIGGKDEVIDGKKLEHLLKNNYGLQVEMATSNSILALTSIGDEKEGFEKLHKALKDIEEKHFDKIIGKKALTTMDTYAIIMQSSLKISEVIDMKKEWMNLENSINRIASQFITIYPPGIPILVPGEVITMEIRDYIVKAVKEGLTVLGIENNKVSVVSKVEEE